MDNINYIELFQSSSTEELEKKYEVLNDKLNKMVYMFPEEIDSLIAIEFILEQRKNG